MTTDEERDKQLLEQKEEGAIHRDDAFEEPVEPNEADVRVAPGHFDPRKRASKRTVSRDERRRRSAGRKTRRRTLFGIGGGAIALMLIAGLVVPSLGGMGTVYNPAANDGSNQPPPEQVGTDVPIMAGEVIALDAAHEPYTTLPPTSGPRYEEPAPWGISSTQLAEEAVVRNLEHGAVAINHNVTDPAVVLVLREFIEEQQNYPACIVAQPHGSVPAGQVVLTAWGVTETYEPDDRVGMQRFIGTHSNVGPLFVDATCGAEVAAAQTGAP